MVPSAVLIRNFRLVGGASYTPLGVAWLARVMFGLGGAIAPDREQFIKVLNAVVANADSILAEEVSIAGVDADSAERNAINS